MSEECEIQFLITNLEFPSFGRILKLGEEPERGHLILSIDNHNIVLEQAENYREIIKGLRNGAQITTRMIVRENPENWKAVTEVVDNLCSLMSFMNGNSIFSVEEIGISKGKITHHKLYNPKIENFKPAPQFVPPMKFKSFLEKTYSNFVKFKDVLGLPILFNYYVLMNTSDYLEVSCLFGYILLECLSYHAQEYYKDTSIPIQSSLLKDNVRKIRKILHKNYILENRIDSITKELLEKEVIYQHPTLPDSIYRIMKDFNIDRAPDDQEIFDLRNHYVHEGISPKRGREHTEFTRRFTFFIFRLLSGILGYDVPAGY
jgi:hypothetical protein